MRNILATCLCALVAGTSGSARSAGPSTRRRFRVGAATAVAVLAATLAVRGNQMADRFTFVAPNAPESTIDGKGPLDLVLIRWSDDDERRRVYEAMKSDGATAVLNALGTAPNAGYLRWPGGVEYSVRYARRTMRPAGGTDVVLLVDRPLWVWWESAGFKPSTDYPFTLIHIRIDKGGSGEGRSSLTTAVRADEQAGIALEDAAKGPVLMTNVRHHR